MRSERYEAAMRDFSRFRDMGGVTPCQLMPSSMFLRKIRPHMPLDELNDSLAASDACRSCPLWRQCRIIGEDEKFGMWGGVSRHAGVFRRDTFDDDWPMS